jgi:hypothetical protein
MTLQFTGDFRTTVSGTEYIARGSKAAETIVVNISADVIKRYGEERAKDIASAKYDAEASKIDTIVIRDSDFPV